MRVNDERAEVIRLTNNPEDYRRGGQYHTPVPEVIASDIEDLLDDRVDMVKVLRGLLASKDTPAYQRAVIRRLALEDTAQNVSSETGGP